MGKGEWGMAIANSAAGSASAANAGASAAPAAGAAGQAFFAKPVSRLEQWPCQIRLPSTQALTHDGAKLLILADCTAYAYATVHEDFMKESITLVGCPKLDPVDYSGEADRHHP